MEADEVTAIVCKWARIWTNRTWGYVSYNEAYTDLLTIANQVHTDNPECTQAFMNKRMDWEMKRVNQKAVIRKNCMRERMNTHADALEGFTPVDGVSKPDRSLEQKEIRDRMNDLIRDIGQYIISPRQKKVFSMLLEDCTVDEMKTAFQVNTNLEITNYISDLRRTLRKHARKISKQSRETLKLLGWQERAIKKPIYEI
jgi:hypothetical protein